jgi:hypothetical protein
LHFVRNEEVLQELEAAAARLDVKVSYEALQAIAGAGGMCRVKGQFRIIIDKRAQVSERVATLAQGLAQFDTSELELSSQARDLVRHYAMRRAG